jgi:hypothetical protein
MKVRKAILLLEDATRLVSVLDLFSRNERISEVPTSTLKFFLLPVLLGDLNSKLVDNNDRLELIKIVEAYYRDFLQRVKDYEIVEDLRLPKPMCEDDDEEKPVPSGPPGSYYLTIRCSIFIAVYCKNIEYRNPEFCTMRLKMLSLLTEVFGPEFAGSRHPYIQG